MEDGNINSIITSLAPWNAADNSQLYFIVLRVMYSCASWVKFADVTQSGINKYMI